MATDEPEGGAATAPALDRRAQRKFLVVVDDTSECRVAVRYAARRAERTGGSLLLLRVIETRTELAHWLAVEQRLRDEATAAAELLLHTVASEIHDWTGLVPAVAIREGMLQDELIAQIEADPAISVLVLAAAPGNEGPGPLVSVLAGKLSGRMRIPVTVVPGGLSDEQVDRLA